MTTTQRVFDSDIQDDNEEAMRSLAAAIALSYRGNWDSMIGWQQHCRTAQPLGKKDVRTILNMSLSDSLQTHWHAEIRQHIREVKTHMFPSTWSKPPHLTVVRTEPAQKRKWIVDTDARFNSDFAKPNHVMGKIHLVDHGRTFIQWSIPQLYGAGGRCIERSVDDPKVPTLIIFGWCGKRYNDVLMPEDPEGDDLICAGCRRVRDEIGKPPSQTRKCR